jgi:ElaB/YqjD/DUF883 family membrane-anchored ribosome-binding protein
LGEYGKRIELEVEPPEEIVMGKKKAAQAGSTGPEEGGKAARAPGDAETHRSPEVEAAAEAVQQAEAELKKARDFYREVRRKATERLSRVREKRLGDLVDETLKLVRKHPGPSVVIAALVGFWLGRLFRR